MARRVFFSFHYERDIWRVNQIRNSWVTRERESAGFWDASLWETTKTKGDAAVKRLIDDGLLNTSVTAVLIGAETDGRPYVDYEIEQSYNRGNGLLGIYIHKLRAPAGEVDRKGTNPFDRWHVTSNDGLRTYFSRLFPTYDWVDEDGYNNFAKWVELAANRAGR